MTKEEIEQIEKELEEISAWPWKWNEEEDRIEAREPNKHKTSTIVETDSCYYPPYEPDRNFIVKSPERTAALIQRVKELEKELDHFYSNFIEKIFYIGEKFR